MCDQHKRDKQHHRDKPEEPKEKLKESNHVPVDDKKTSDDHDQTVSYVSQVNSNKIILLKTLHVKVIAPGGGWREVRVLFDEGSQRSYIKKSLAEEMGCEKLGQETMTTLLFGGGKKGLQARVKYNVLLGSTNGSNSCYKNNFILLDEPVLCQNVPSIPSGPWVRELQQKGIQLTDTRADTPDVEILIGSNYRDLLMTGKTVRVGSGLTATETLFGWTLSGAIMGNDDVNIGLTTISLFANGERPLSDLWTLDAIGIREPIESKSREDQDAEAKCHFKQTVKREADGRYVIELPWIDSNMDVPTNSAVAGRRLRATVQKLEEKGQLESYNKIFNDWLEEGFVSICDEDFSTTKEGHLLPHHPVFKESKTTPVRPVFDASSHSPRTPSLNECLYKGPNMMEKIPDHLLRFREKEIGFISDIRKAFQMVSICERDRNFLKFLWWEGDGMEKQAIVVLQHNRVVFGVNCSPFILSAVIELHLENVVESQRPTSHKLLQALYVDNCVSSASDFRDYEDFKSKSIEIMNDAKMDLREWEHTGEEGTTNVLGLRWNKRTDELSCMFKVEDLDEKITKRKIMSILHKVYDPKGFTCPAILYPKIILQQLWERKIGWDEELPEDLKKEFIRWHNEIEDLIEIKIPRHAFVKGPTRVELHCFTDASKLAYAAVVYAVSKDDEEIKIQLVGAKSRVSPLKKSSIPR
ncbi:unnamed protein product [Orchesella dallaii]|uniref:Peptidase aspartic putative domain-containing protein n=1 Tax=Orchesella dallaii TaxID=48710 RepID=A0ABP1RU37_9HEXA